jgi:thiol-disulfide isomerase/thioredoxin
MKKVGSVALLQQEINKSEKTVVIFSGSGCSDCLYLDMFIDQVEEKFANQYNFVKCMREEGDLMNYYFENMILGIPSLIIYQNGKEEKRFVSKLRKTQAEIEEFLGE